MDLHGHLLDLVRLATGSRSLRDLNSCPKGKPERLVPGCGEVDAPESYRKEWEEHKA